LKNNLISNDESTFNGHKYLALYGDLRNASENGKLVSAYGHYLSQGKVEGRVPFWSDDKIYCLGAYGTNNVGDDAILHGLLKEYPTAIPIVIKKKYGDRSIPAELLLNSVNFFEKGDILIVGGGGIFTTAQSIQTIYKIVESAVNSGARILILKVGLEAFFLTNETVGWMKEILKSAHTFSVRSLISKQMSEKLFQLSPVIEKDFAFNIVPKTQPKSNDEFLVGISTSDFNIEMLKLYAKFIDEFSKKIPRIKFIAIPHSRSFFQWENNDVVTQNILWSTVNDYSDTICENFILKDYPTSPEELIDFYSHLDCVIAERFHACIFAIINSVPLLVNHRTNDKLAEFFRIDYGMKVFNYLREDNFYEVMSRFIKSAYEEKISAKLNLLI